MKKYLTGEDNRQKYTLTLKGKLNRVYFRLRAFFEKEGYNDFLERSYYGYGK